MLLDMMSRNGKEKQTNGINDPGYTGFKVEALKDDPYKLALPSGGQYRKALSDADHSFKR